MTERRIFSPSWRPCFRTQGPCIAGLALALVACSPQRAPQESASKAPANAQAAAPAGANHVQDAQAARGAADAQDAQAANAKPDAVAKQAAKDVGAHKGIAPAWTLLPKQSFLGVEVLKGTGQHYARFRNISGSATHSAQGWASVNVSVTTESFEADVPAFAAHVRSEHFLNTKKFPKATFVSTSMRKDPGPVQDRYMLEGKLTLRGVTQSITLPVDIKREANRVEWSGHTPLDFKSLGMSAHKIANELIDSVELSLRFVFEPSPAGKNPA